MQEKTDRVPGCTCDIRWLGGFMQGGHVVCLNYTGVSRLPVDRKCPVHAAIVTKVFAKANLIDELSRDLHDFLPGLKELYLPNNRLETLPEGLSLLGELESLNLQNNRVQRLPADLTGLANLRVLALRGNRLDELPRGIGELANLKLLDLSFNNIRSIHCDVIRCAKLNKLWMSHNRLTSLPRHLCSISSLKEICASSNNLLFLPIDLGKSDAFELLQCSDNKLLRAVPSHLAGKLGNYTCSFRSPLNGDIASHFGVQLLTAPTSSGSDVMMLQPLHVTAVEPRRSRSLKELCLVLLHGCLRAGVVTSAHFDVLPSRLRDRVLTPDGHCYRCDEPLFGSAHLQHSSTIGFAQTRLETVGYFCGLKCAR